MEKLINLETKFNIDDPTELNKEILKYECFINDPNCFIFEYFKNIRDQIDINREKWKIIIDNYYDGILKKLELCESECKSNLPDLKYFDNINSFRREENDKESTALLNNCSLRDVKLEIKKIECEILQGRSYKFEIHNSRLDFEDLFGSLIIETNSLNKTRNLISCSADKTINIWNLEKGICEKSLSGHNDYVYCVKLLSIDILVSSGWDNMIKIWNLKNGKCIKSLYCKKCPLDIAKVKDDEFISGHLEGEINLWYIYQEKPLRKFIGHISDVNKLESYNNFRNFFSYSEDGIIRIWDLKSFECMNIISLESEFKNITSIKINENLNSIICSTEEGKIISCQLDNSKFQEIFKIDEANINTIELISYDKIAVGLDNRSLLIVDVLKKQIVISLSGHQKCITCLKFLSNGTLASGSADKSIIIWDLKIFKCIQKLTKHEKSILNFEEINF